MKVTIERAEGPIELLGTFEFDSFDKATKHFADNILSFPNLGYDKHDVEIEFDNGDKLSIRIDAVSRNSEYFTKNRHDVEREAVMYLRFLMDYTQLDEASQQEARDMLITHFGG